MNLCTQLSLVLIENKFLLSKKFQLVCKVIKLGSAKTKGAALVMISIVYLNHYFMMSIRTYFRPCVIKN